jgi:hypothetical protein
MLGLLESLHWSNWQDTSCKIVRCKEHIWNIRQNKDDSEFVLHILSKKYEVLSETSRTRSKKKCWLNLLNFGCHLLQNNLIGKVYRDPIIFFHASKAMWGSFSLMLSSTGCQTLFQNVVPSVSLSIWETKWNHRGLSLASREDAEL